MQAFIATLVLLAAHLSHVSGHAFMSDPAARQYQNYKQTGQMGDDAEPMTAYGGRRKRVSNDGKLTWPAGNPYSMCGDNTAAKRWMKPRKVQRTYKAGQVVKLKVVMWQWHEGRYSFWVCKKGTTALRPGRCTQLWRADKKSRYFYAPRYIPGYHDLRSAVPEKIRNNPFTWSRLPRSGTPYDNFNGTPEVAIRYRLPKNLRCKGCFMVWHYLTGNACIPPCDPADPNYNNGRCSTKMPTCGTPGSTYPEEFWNCADITIR